MDSKTDVPVILSDGYAKAMAMATMEAIADRAKLAEKAATAALELPVLARGHKSEAVRAMQALLSLRGFPCDPDGSFGPATLEQVKAFCKGGTVCDAAAWAELLGVGV